MSQQMETQTPPLEVLETRDLIETRNFQSGNNDRIDTAVQDDTAKILTDDVNANDDADLLRPSFEIGSGSATDEAHGESRLDNLNSGNREITSTAQVLDSGNGGILSHDPSSRSMRKNKLRFEEDSSNQNAGSRQQQHNEKSRSNSKMGQLADMQMSFQINQPYDNLAMTQQRDKLPSSQLDRKPIDVAAAQNAFRVTIEQGSADSKESASNHHHRMSKKPTLIVKETKGTGTILMQDSTRGFHKMEGSMGSTSQRSFEVNPRYSSRPRVTIEATQANLNQDLQIQISGGQGPPYMQISPSRTSNGRKLTEVQTTKVPFDGTTQLTKEQEHPSSPNKLSPSLRGAKLNMKKQASVNALRGVNGSPRAQNKQVFGPKHQFITQPFTVTNTPKKKIQVHGGSKLRGSSDPHHMLQQLHQQTSPNQLDPFANVLSGQRVKIKATPASKFIQQRKQQLVDMGPNGVKLGCLDSSTQAMQRTTLQAFPIPEVMSRETPEIDDPSHMRGSPQYYTTALDKQQQSSTGLISDRGQRNTKYLNQSSSHRSTGINTAKPAVLQQHLSAAVRQGLSKDLIAVINDQSEENTSSYNEKGVSTSQPQLNVNTNTAAPTPDHKRGSAITFFDDSDIENDKKDMNMTLDGFKRPSKRGDNWSPNKSGASIGDRQQSNPSPNSSRMKNTVLSNNNLSSSPLNTLKKNLIEFHNNHTLKVKASEQQLLELFPELAAQIDIPNNQMYTSNIPRIDMMINEKLIGKNSPASGIRIFEEHNSHGGFSPTNRNRQSNKSLSPSPSQQTQNSRSNNHQFSAGNLNNDSGMLIQDSNQNSQTNLGLQHQASYQVAPLQGSAAVEAFKNSSFTGINHNNTGGMQQQQQQQQQYEKYLKGTDSSGTLPGDVGSPLSQFANSKKRQDIEGGNKSDASFNNRANTIQGPHYALTMNEHKRVMQTFSPKPVQPDLSLALRAEGIQGSGSRLDRQQQNASAMKKKKLTVQIEQNRQLIKNQDAFDGNKNLDITQQKKENKRRVDRKNTEVLGNSFGVGSQSKIGSNTMQKVMDIQENLNVTIQNGEQMPRRHQRRDQESDQGDNSMLDAIHSIEDSVYKQGKKQVKDSSGQVDQQMEVNGLLEDAVTLEQKESAMARYLDMHGQGNEMRITATSKNNAFNLTNNMMSLRQMQPKEASVFPMEAPPPVKTTQRFNVTQFRKQMQMIDTNAKFNMSFLASPRQNQPFAIDRQNAVNAQQQKTFSNMLQSPQTDMRIKINHRQQKTGIPMGHGSLGFNKQTIADRIREVKEKHKYAGTPSLSQQQPVTTSNFSPTQRSRSIDIRVKRNSNPFSVGGLHTLTSPKGMMGSPMGATNLSNQHQTLISDVAKRFKNISDREAPANHISDKVYAVAQNQSLYNNAYQYLPGVEAGEKQQPTTNRFSPTQKNHQRAQLSQSVNAAQRISKQNLVDPNDMKTTVRVRNKYQQRKLSHLERPTQLEIGGEGAPMLSLLPPLKTREISPKYNYQVGKGVKEQQTSMANLRLNQDREVNQGQQYQTKNNNGQKQKGGKGNRKSNQKPKIIHVPNTKIIISSSGDSPPIQSNKIYGEADNSNLIHNHPVMIKAIASQKSLLHSKGTAENTRKTTNLDNYDDGLVNDMLESAQGAQDLDLRLDSSTANYMQNEYRDVFLVNAAQPDHGLGALHMNPMDASLNEKLAQMANRVYKDVTVPLNQHREDDPVAYERRELNIDGTWKEHRYQSRHQAPGGPGFHFLEYAKSNFRNPLELIQQHNAAGGGSSGVTTVAQTQALAFDSYDHIAAKSKRNGKSSARRGKSRTKRGHHSQGYHVDEKFSLKVQKKPINGLQHIKVEQADGPGGIKLYSIKVQQKSPRFVSGTRVKDSIEAGFAARKETLNTTRHWQDATLTNRQTILNETDRKWQDGFDQEIMSPMSPSSQDLDGIHSRVQMVARDLQSVNQQHPARDTILKNNQATSEMQVFRDDEGTEESIGRGQQVLEASASGQ